MVRTLEIVAGLILALIAFVVLKVLGILLKFALIAAVIGFVVGLLITRMFRSSTS